MTTRLCGPPTIKGPDGEIIKQNAAGQLCITCDTLEAWLKACGLQDTFYVIEGPDADGIVTATYTAPDGTTTTTQWETDDDATVVDNGDGSISYVDSDGTVVGTWWDGCAVSLEMTGDNEWTFTNAEGVTTIITDDEFDEMLVDNGDDSYTWTDHDGNTFTFGAGGDIGEAVGVENPDGTIAITLTDVNGNTFVCPSVSTQRFATMHDETPAAKGQLIHFFERSRFADGSYLIPVAYSDSGDGLCTPTPPPCPDLGATTVDNSGRVWNWAPGGPWTCQDISYAEAVQEFGRPNTSVAFDQTLAVGDEFLVASGTVIGPCCFQADVGGTAQFIATWNSDNPPPSWGGGFSFGYQLRVNGTTVDSNAGHFVEPDWWKEASLNADPNVDLVYEQPVSLAMNAVVCPGDLVELVFFVQSIFNDNQGNNPGAVDDFIIQVSQTSVTLSNQGGCA